MTADTTRPTSRIFRNGSPCPEPGCDGKLVKRYGQYRDMEGSRLICSKYGENPHIAKNIEARRARERKISVPSRAEFFAQKQLRFGHDGLEARYGCPYWVLHDWVKDRVPWRESMIAGAKANPDDPYWIEYSAFMKVGNAGIAKINKEYKKAVSRFRRAAS